VLAHERGNPQIVVGNWSAGGFQFPADCGVVPSGGPIDRENFGQSLKASELRLQFVLMPRAGDPKTVFAEHDARLGTASDSAFPTASHTVDTPLKKAETALVSRITASLRD